MRRVLNTILAVLILFPTAVIAQRDTPVWREIESLNREMTAAFNRGDMKKVASFYADNAVVRHGTGVAANGRQQIDAYWAGIKDAKSWALEVRGVTPAEGTNLVYQTGKSTLVSGTPEHASVVGFLLVWQRQPDGKLKAILDYYHPEPQRSANP
jgi:ketosteroid isomerase-like protein